MMKSRKILGVEEYGSFNIFASSNGETLIDKALLSEEHSQSNVGSFFPGFSLLEKSSNGSLTPESSSGYPLDIPASFNPSMSIVLLILVGVLIFMGFFSIYVRYHTSDEEERRGGSGNGRMRASQGLDENVIKTFPLFRYSSVKGLKQGKYTQECSFCLSEFQDDETLRILPKCRHAFHPDCIDMWLYSHTTCPLCRCSLLPEPHHGALQSLRPDLPQEAGATPSQENDQVVVVIGARNARQDGADNEGRETNEANSFRCNCRTEDLIQHSRGVYTEDPAMRHFVTQFSDASFQTSSLKM